jgi:hypothetical protein
MVQVHVIGPSRKELIRENVGQSIGQGLANFTNTYFSNKSLEDTLKSKDYQKASPAERAGLLERSMSGFGDTGAQILQNRLGIEQKLGQEREQRVLAKVMKGGDVSEEEFGQLAPENQLKVLQRKQTLESSNRLKQALKDRDVADDVADNIGDLYASATEGGKTEILKNVLELEKRGLLGKKEGEAQKPAENERYPEIEPEPGLTPKEKVDLKASYRKENFPIYNETQAKTKALKVATQAANILTQLNEEGDLPEGAEKWNVNWETGEARVPALLSADAQRFIKTVNDFTTKAKDSYGGRVTNFELDRFMKRLPTLANSKEGRRVILQQMKLLNELDSAYENELKNVFQHYGIGNIPYEDAVGIAEKNVADEEAGIIQELNGLVEKSEQPQNVVPEGEVKVRFNGQEGSMSRENYERALKAGKKYELIQ